MNAKSKLLIIEDQTILRMGLRAMLDREPDIEVVGEAENSHAILQMVNTVEPDLVMMDFNTQNNDGANTIAGIRRQHPATRILVLTQHKSEQCIRQALQAGASGYVLKDVGNTELIAAVRSVLAGKIYLSPSISDKVINVFLVGNRMAAARSDLEALTRREREILKMVAEGRTSRHIATDLNLSVKTVEKHRSNLMRKLDLHNVSALTTFAIGQGLVTTNP